MPRKKRAILAMMENLTKTAGENAPKRQKCDHPTGRSHGGKPKPGKENKNVCHSFQILHVKSVRNDT
jgi:hypothetical protein